MRRRAGTTGTAPVVVLTALLMTCRALGGISDFRSPLDVHYSPDGALLAVSDHTRGVLYVVDVASVAVRHAVPLNGKPISLAWRSDTSCLVAEYDAGTVAEVDAATGRVVRRLPVGPKPVGVAAASGTAVVTEYGRNRVYLVDLKSGESQSIAVRRHPYFAALDRSGKRAVVGHLIPDTPSVDPASAAAVSVIDVATGVVTAEILLPDGSSNVRGIAISGDGHWGYVLHTRGRVALPTTQLDRGWVNTNVMTILDLLTGTRVTSVLLDYVQEGAADPWGIALSSDSRTAWITLSGAQQLARVDLGTLHELMAGTKEDIGTYDAYSGSAAEIWTQIKKGEKTLDALSYYLNALYGMDLIRRKTVPLNGPRGIAVAPDDGTVAVCAYFGGALQLLDPNECEMVRAVSLGDQPAADAVRDGERIFHDATYCFQKWLSCATCHPTDGRADGLNWDLLNDGIGNSKNTKSLLWSDRTPPVMSTGVRSSMDMATAKGFQFIQFVEVAEGDLEKVRVYLRSLEPEPSPYLVNGRLSEKAERGKALFEDQRVGCMHCHPPPLYTDLKSYDVGTRHARDRTGTFDNPTLVEMWRSGPYLHDGSAATLMDVLTVFNEGDRHGRTSHLTDEERDALVEYLLSL